MYNENNRGPRTDPCILLTLLVIIEMPPRLNKQRNIAKLQNMLSVSDAEKLVHAFMTSRLDYCNALLGGCPASSINKIQIVQNAAARVLTRSRKYDHITPILQSLHWLPINFRISYKILLLAYKALNDFVLPSYQMPCLIWQTDNAIQKQQMQGIFSVLF